MAGVLDSVNQRTQLVGQNRLELLLFNLGGSQTYGINVFKVKEVLQCPKLNEVPKRHPVVRGVAHIRGGTIPIMDLKLATGQAPLENIDNCFVVITEYNRSIQGFLVNGVERIINMNWTEIMPPPRGAGNDNYLTAVTKIDERLVEIIDVEKILSEVSPMSEHVSEEIIENAQKRISTKKHILVLDDSSVARKQVASVAQSMGFETTLCLDGRDGLRFLSSLVDEGKKPSEELMMVISDIEMPEMDGYTFTSELRSHPELKDIYIVLHTSLSGVFNESMVKKVGADSFIPKFSPDELGAEITRRINEVSIV